MFAYLISKLLCNIYQSLDVRSEKCFSGMNKNIVWIERDPERDLSRKHFESARQENYLLRVYPDFSFGNQSCHSLGSFLCMTGSH